MVMVNNNTWIAAPLISSMLLSIIVVLPIFGKMQGYNCSFYKIRLSHNNILPICIIYYNIRGKQQAEAEIVTSSSLVEVDVEVEVGVEAGVEVGVAI